MKYYKFNTSKIQLAITKQRNFIPTNKITNFSCSIQPEISHAVFNHKLANQIATEKTSVAIKLE